MNKIEKILRESTVNLFNDDWYEKTVNKIKGIDQKEYGYVYFVRNGYSNSLKIGKSLDLNKRVKGFNTLMPDGVFLHGFIYSKDFSNIEKELHLRFKDLNIKGEWFNIEYKDFESKLSDYDIVNVNGFLELNSSVIEGEYFNFKPINYFKGLDPDMVLFFNNCEKLETNKKYCKSSFYKESISLDKSYESMSKKRINLQLKKWCNANSFNYNCGNSNGSQWFIISKK